jgi:hypothetical protein
VQEFGVDRITCGFDLALKLLEGAVDRGLASAEKDAELLNVDGKSRGQEEDPADKTSLPVIVVSSFDEVANFPEAIRKCTKAFAFFGFGQFITKFGVKMRILHLILVGEEGNVTGLIWQSVARRHAETSHWWRTPNF